MSLRDQYGLNETAVIELKDANDEAMVGADGKQCTVTVFAPGTKQANKARARDINVATERVQRKGKTKITGEEYGVDRVDYGVMVTQSVSDNLASEFAGLTGPDLFRKLYSDPDLGTLILDQVYTEQQKKENFTKGSTAN